MTSAILLGSKPGSVVALRTMLNRGWDVPAVVTTDADSHAWIAGPTLRAEAEGLGIATLPAKDLPGLVDEVDLVISYMYRNLVKRPVLNLARRAAVNFHAAPLPGFGGWAFYNVAILENVTEYGCTCHHMDEGFDTGDVLKVRRFRIDPSKETALSLERRAQGEMVRLFVDFCDLVDSGSDLPHMPQDGAQQRYVDRTTFEQMKRIPANADAESADRIARAFWYPPYECAYVEFGGKRFDVVPAAEKMELARRLHDGDFDALLRAATSHTQVNLA